MKQVQWFDSRFYKVYTAEGFEYFPSVTTILNVSPKPFLAKWRGDVGNEEADRIMNEAKHRGTVIHSACEELVKGAVVVLVCDGYETLSKQELSNLETYRRVVRLYNQEHYYQVLKFKALMEALKPSQIETEQAIYSLEFRYAGTMDYLMWIDEGRYEIDGAKPVQLEAGWYIADIKTGNSISDDVYMQLGAYRHAVQQARGLEVKGGLVIHTNSSAKKGIEGLSCKLRTAKELDLDFQNFMRVYEVWAINPSASAPRIFTMPVMLQWSAPKPKLSAAVAEVVKDAGMVSVSGKAEAVVITEDELLSDVKQAERVALRMSTDGSPLTSEEVQFFEANMDLVKAAHERLLEEKQLPAPAAVMPDKAPARTPRAAKTTAEKYPNALDKNKKEPL